MPAVLLDEHSAAAAIEKLLLKQFGRVPPRWLRAIATHEPALVHAHFGSSVLPARHIAALLGIPLIVTYHGLDIAVRPTSSAEVERRRTAFAVADRVIAISGYIAHLLRDAGCPPDKIISHNIGIDTTLFTPGNGPRAADRVLFVGRLVAKKGVIHLLRAMERVQSVRPATELVICGDGGLRASLEAESRGRGVRATFLGVRTPDQVRDLMREATVVCGPSIADARGNNEGLGMVFIEAQACASPVVVSTAGGAAEGVVDGETGLVFPPGDDAQLADRLLTLLGDPALRRRMGEAARAHVLRNFDLAIQTAKLEAIYDEVRGLHRVPASRQPSP
jgi:colanic acid/amylovoran biosynthesis glycosyltransferase